MFASDRGAYRRTFLTVWRKSRQGEALEPLERQILQAIERHPEYHELFADEHGVLNDDYPPEQGQTNPFLHLGLHLAISDQLALDQPPGIRDHFQTLAAAWGDPHRAEHRLMDCLAEQLWHSQRAAVPFDPAAYLDCVARATATGSRR